MKHEPIKRYVGPLSAEQIAKGMSVAAANSKRLLEDAQLLYEQERYPSACSLAILSIGEAGKLVILREMASRPEDIQKVWKSYRTHQAKNVHWIN
jgi:AbiV family abortive infection protein